MYVVFWDFSLEQMSCKSFLKLQVVIISLDAFQVFCEARVNTRSPLSNVAMGLRLLAARRL